MEETTIPEDTATTMTDTTTTAAVDTLDAQPMSLDQEPAKETTETSTEAASNGKVGADGNADDNGDDDDDDDSSSTTSTKSSMDEDSKKIPSEDPELLLIKANTLKEEGNNFFKEKEFEKASRAYRRGTNTLKPLNRGNMGDDQVKALLVNLQTNLSMMCLKLGKAKQSVDVATSALAIDPANVKALYRRAIARRQLGETDLAKADLREALEWDPSNTAVKKELASLKKSLEDAKQAQKVGLQKAFSKSGSGLGLLYDDKEREKQLKEDETKRKKQEEEELLKKRKIQWEDECVKRMAKGEEAISFEDWDKQRKKKEKEVEKRKKEERRQAREAARAASKRDVAADDDDDSDDELTEKELAQLRGYKKTSDGRVTSYFTREQSAQEKDLIGDIAPQRLLVEPSNIPTPISTTSSSSTDLVGKGNPSAWNQAGTTWEERNTTDWCRERLEIRLKETKVIDGNFVGLITSVENMTGDASVAIASGKKRYIFDFHCSVKFEIQESDTDEIVASGTLKLPDICSTHHEELEVEISGGWKKKPSSSDNLVKAENCRTSLITSIRESVTGFVTDFNNEY